MCSGNVVREFIIGNTKIKIRDDYCKNKDENDVKKILNKISQNIMNDLNNSPILQCNNNLANNEEIHSHSC